MVNLCLVCSHEESRMENVPSPPSPEQPPLAPNDPPYPSPNGLRHLEQRQEVAVALAMQTQVLKTCAQHNELYCDEDADPAAAFSLAVDLVKHRAPYVAVFGGHIHELTDLLTVVISAAPAECPNCPTGAAPQMCGEIVTHTPRRMGALSLENNSPRL